MMNEMIYVTPSLKAKESLLREGRRWADAIGAVFVPRRGRTRNELREAYGDNVLVYSSRGPQIDRPEGVHFFSLNMAELRIQNIRKGGTDHLIEAIGADGPIRLLDCTCGFGADAMTASFALPAGSVVYGLESSPLLAAVTAWGFAHFCHPCGDVTAALRRICLRRGDYMDYLRDPQAEPYDVLYFDPMFSHPVEGSCQFQPVRAMMDHRALTAEALRLAVKKARRRVVVKGRSFDKIAGDFPDVKHYGGKYSRVAYVVLKGEA